MRPAELLAILAAAASVPAARPGKRNRRRRRRTKRHRADIKLRCRTLERYRSERAILGPPITARSTIRARTLRAVLRAQGHHVEPNVGFDL